MVKIMAVMLVLDITLIINTHLHISKSYLHLGKIYYMVSVVKVSFRQTQT